MRKYAQSKTFIQCHSLAIYFGACYIISWGSGLLVLGPKLARGDAVTALDELLLFPVLVIGVGLVSIILTTLVQGKLGIRELGSRMKRWQVGTHWYAAALLIPPLLILLVLSVLRILVSPVFALNFFPFGVVFGVFPGLIEELGWTGFALSRMQLQRRGILISGIVLGLLWGLWHLPVVDYLGAAAPHGIYWLPFFCTFVALVTAIRGGHLKTLKRCGKIGMSALQKPELLTKFGGQSLCQDCRENRIGLIYPMASGDA